MCRGSRTSSSASASTSRRNATSNASCSTITSSKTSSLKPATASTPGRASRPADRGDQRLSGGLAILLRRPRRRGPRRRSARSPCGCTGRGCGAGCRAVRATSSSTAAARSAPSRSAAGRRRGPCAVGRGPDRRRRVRWPRAGSGLADDRSDGTGRQGAAGCQQQCSGHRDGEEADWGAHGRLQGGGDVRCARGPAARAGSGAVAPRARGPSLTVLAAALATALRVVPRTCPRLPLMTSDVHDIVDEQLRRTRQRYTRGRRQLVELLLTPATGHDPGAARALGARSRRARCTATSRSWSSAARSSASPRPTTSPATS
jgi:hypothetical protein